MKHVLKLLFIAFLAFAKIAFGQSTGLALNTGAQIVNNMGLAGIYTPPVGGPTVGQFTNALAAAIGSSTLQGVDSNGVPIGSNVSGSLNGGVTIAGYTIGVTIQYNYFVGADGNIWLQYTASAGAVLTKTVTSQVSTLTPVGVINGHPTGSMPGVTVVGQAAGTNAGNPGNWITAHVQELYGFMDGAGTYHCVLSTETIVYWFPNTSGGGGKNLN